MILIIVHSGEGSIKKEADHPIAQFDFQNGIDREKGAGYIIMQ